MLRSRIPPGAGRFFPVDRDKRPLTAHGFKDASVKHDQGVVEIIAGSGYRHAEYRLCRIVDYLPELESEIKGKLRSGHNDNDTAELLEMERETDTSERS